MTDQTMINVALTRIVIRDATDSQYIYLTESDGTRGFPIVIGNNEAREIDRVVHGIESPRPMTHQLAYSAIKALGAELQMVDIVDLRQNTFFAHLVLQGKDREETTVVDARPSDAIALALRARCQIRVAETVLATAAASESENGKTEPEP